MSSELALVFIMLVIYFIVSRWLPKMWKPTGKDCLPGTGETESYWQRVFFQCGFTAPRQFLSFPEVFRSFFFFFWGLFLASWYHTLCLLVVPAGIIQCPVEGDTLARIERDEVDLCKETLIIITLRAGLNMFILYCVLIQRTYLPLSHINQGVRMFHRLGGCGKHWASLREYRGRCWFYRRYIPSIFNWLLKMTVIVTKRNPRRSTAAWFSTVCTVSFFVCLYLCLILLNILTNFS